MKIKSIIIITLFFATNAFAVNWRTIYSTNEADYLLDIDSPKISQPSNWVSYDFLINLKKPRLQTDGKSYQSIKTMEIIDCNKNMYVISAGGNFSGRMASGKLIDIVNYLGNSEWKAILTDSVNSEKAKVLCR